MKCDEITTKEHPLTTQLVSGSRLLEILFDADSRPSLRWLAHQTKRRVIPFCKIGRLVRFSPDRVQEALEKLSIRAGGGL